MRRVSAWCGALALVLAAAACGTGGSEGNANEITIWHTESTPETVKALDQIIDAYEKKHPGVTITQENVAWADLQVKMQSALSAGDPPEITQVEPMFVRSLHKQGLLQPVDDVVTSLGPDYYPELKKMFAYGDGHDYGVVHAWGTDLITYRKDLYEKAQAPPPNQAGTWDQWADGLTKVAGANPGVSGLDLAGVEAHNINEEVYMWLGSNGGRLFDDRGHVTIDTPQMVETLEFWRGLQTSGALSKGWASTEYEDTLTALALGQTASILSFGRATYTFEEQAPKVAEKRLIGVSPSKPVGPSGKDWITQLDAEPWVAFKDAPGAGHANSFLKFFYQKENYLKWISTVPTHLLPVQKSLFDDPGYAKLPDVQRWQTWIDTQRKTLESGRARPMMVTDWKDLQLPYLVDLYGSGILADMVKQVVSKGVAPQKAVADAQARADELLKSQYPD